MFFKEITIRQYLTINVTQNFKLTTSAPKNMSQFTQGKQESSFYLNCSWLELRVLNSIFVFVW